MAYTRRYTRRRTYGGYQRRAYSRGYIGGYGTYVPRRRAPARRRATTRRVVPRAVPVPTALSPFAMAQVDPFDERAYGARVPDSNTMPSSCLTDFNEATLTTYGTKAGCWAFLPNVRNYVTNQDTAGGVGWNNTQWLWQANYGGAVPSAKLGNITAQFEVVRPVGHGVRLTCGLSPNNVTGYCHVAIYTLSTYDQTTWKLPTQISDMAECAFYKRYTLASMCTNPITIVNKFLDATSFRYVDPGENTGDAQNTGKQMFHVPNNWGIILVAISGAPADSQPVNAEVVCHYEAINAFSGVGTDSRPEAYNPTVLAGVSEISRNAPTVHAESENSTVLEQARASFARGIQTGINSVAETVVGMAGALGEQGVYAVSNAAVRAATRRSQNMRLTN